jgi:hypothetical protein
MAVHEKSVHGMNDDERRVNKVQYTHVRLVYGFCDWNVWASVEEHRRRFPKRRHASTYVFSEVYQRL